MFIIQRYDCRLVGRGTRTYIYMRLALVCDHRCNSSLITEPIIWHTFVMFMEAKIIMFVYDGPGRDGGEQRLFLVVDVAAVERVSSCMCVAGGGLLAPVAGGGGRAHTAVAARRPAAAAGIYRSTHSAVSTLTYLTNTCCVCYTILFSLWRRLVA